jgi:hypothetical protein
LIELRFHRALYAGPSVDEAVKIFASYATFELDEEPEHWRVRITAAFPDRERRIAGELGNYALGLTVKSGGATPAGQKASA